MSGLPFKALNRRDMPDEERYVWVVGTMIVCALLFASTWVLSNTVPIVKRQFAKFDFKNRCDWCSRTASVVHANVVLYYLWQETLYNVEWNEWFQTTSNLSVLERNMCISAGYFLYDLTVVLASRMDLWQIFVFHHVAALWPLLFVLFGGCENYAFFGSGYFFVEMTILPLQLVHWCETLKKPNSWIAALGYHLTFWLWLPFRLVIPVYMTYNGIGVVMQGDDTVGFWQCKLPVGQGGVAIWAFCWLIFAAHIGPGYYKRVVKGEQPNEHPAPKKKPAAPKKTAGKKETPASPMSPVMSPTFKASS